jgi:hypothetical protein
MKKKPEVIKAGNVSVKIDAFKNKGFRWKAPTGLETIARINATQ